MSKRFLAPRACAAVAAFISLAGAKTHNLAEPPAFAVVELFTSQGCSSCPPAEKLLEEMRDRPGIITLACHVTYWDHLGWKDPFSLAACTESQNEFASWLHNDQVYTPQMVINGQAEFVGSDRQRLNAELEKARGVPLLPLHIVALSASNEKISFRVLMDSLPAPRRIPMRIVSFIRQASIRTAIPRGENAGTTWTNASVIRTYIESPRFVAPSPAREFKVSLGTVLPTTGLDVVCLLQNTETGSVLAIGISPLP